MAMRWRLRDGREVVHTTLFSCSRLPGKLFVRVVKETILEEDEENVSRGSDASSLCLRRSLSLFRPVSLFIRLPLSMSLSMPLPLP